MPSKINNSDSPSSLKEELGIGNSSIYTQSGPNYFALIFKGFLIILALVIISVPFTILVTNSQGINNANEASRECNQKIRTLEANRINYSSELKCDSLEVNPTNIVRREFWTSIMNNTETVTKYKRNSQTIDQVKNEVEANISAFESSGSVNKMKVYSQLGVISDRRIDSWELLTMGEKNEVIAQNQSNILQIQEKAIKKIDEEATRLKQQAAKYQQILPQAQIYVNKTDNYLKLQPDAKVEGYQNFKADKEDFEKLINSDPTLQEKYDKLLSDKATEELKQKFGQ
jgi:hypothetical protein